MEVVLATRVGVLEPAKHLLCRNRAAANDVDFRIDRISRYLLSERSANSCCPSNYNLHHTRQYSSAPTTRQVEVVLTATGALKGLAACAIRSALRTVMVVVLT